MLGTGLVTAHLKLLQRALLQRNGSTQSNSTHILFQMVCSDFLNSSVSGVKMIFINFYIQAQLLLITVLGLIR